MDEREDKKKEREKERERIPEVEREEGRANCAVCMAIGKEKRRKVKTCRQGLTWRSVLDGAASTKHLEGKYSCQSFGKNIRRLVLKTNVLRRLTPIRYATLAVIIVSHWMVFRL